MDDAEHVFFKCDRWLRQRLEEVTPEHIIPCMLKRGRNWDVASDFVNQVQSTRENEERERQRNQIVH
ncbi:unnamed protein product [Macrosiphum euphorbiae]|uniref:Uncharacterized protein n=1 Tax=Macrosiphum euphorbiae TaxID=13131 RepID=A0AAV0WRA5_9HEMI|nr:unnamed protein product [Macrosiphum euphorbiae]